MDKITFQQIMDNLSCGREIEFSYHGKLYSITTSQGFWNFCCGDRLLEKICSFEDKDALVKKVAMYRIDDISIPDIFDG